MIASREAWRLVASNLSLKNSGHLKRRIGNTRYMDAYEVTFFAASFLGRPHFV